MPALRVSAILLLAPLRGLFAQTAQAPVAPDPILRITVTLVQVDTVVTDSQGRHVSNLSADDFELLQDGQPQKITHFSYIAAPPPPAAPVKDAPQGPPVPLTSAQVKRVIALVVDDMALSFEHLVTVREALKKYVSRQLQPGDLVALVRTGGGVAILEQFTTDRRVLTEAIDLLKWRFSGRTGLGAIRPAPGERSVGPQLQPQVLDYSYTLSALGALGTIEQVIQGMKRFAGRKSVVFFSDSLRMDPNLTVAMDRLVDQANRSAVSIYSVDPGGLRASRPRPRPEPVTAIDDDTRTGRFPPVLGTPEEDDPRASEGLRYLATRTGGLFYHNRNDIPECIGQAADDQMGYYLLAYSPKAETFEPNGGKPKFHRVVVRVKQRGLEARWKSGFAGIPDEIANAVLTLSKTREEQLLEALASPFLATAIKVRLTSMYTELPNIGPVVYSMLHFRSQDLTFRQDDAGEWHATVDIVTSAYRGFKETISQRQRVQEIRLSDEQYRRSLKEGFLLTLGHQVKEPGMFLMRAVVRDTTSERIGAASQSVQVPDTRKGKFALSGIIVKLSSPEAVGVASGPVNGGSDGQVQPWSEGGPAVRRYLPGQSLMYAYLVINPARKHASPAITSFIRLYRDGQLIYTGKPMHAIDQDPQVPFRYASGGTLSLGKRLTPGEYLLQVIVTDDSRKKTQASQWIDFEVVAPPAGNIPSQD